MLTKYSPTPLRGLNKNIITNKYCLSVNDNVLFVFALSLNYVFVVLRLLWFGGIQLQLPDISGFSKKKDKIPQNIRRHKTSIYFHSVTIWGWGRVQNGFSH